jgi:hypothetical protein
LEERIIVISKEGKEPQAVAGLKEKPAGAASALLNPLKMEDI